jgi:hypothetical protein
MTMFTRTRNRFGLAVAGSLAVLTSALMAVLINAACHVQAIV